MPGAGAAAQWPAAHRSADARLDPTHARSGCFAGSGHIDLPGKDLGRDYHFARELVRARLLPSAKILPFRVSGIRH